MDIRTEHPILADAARQLWPHEAGLFDTEPLHFLLDEAPAVAGQLEFVPDADRFTFRAGPDVEGWFQLGSRRGAIITDAESASLMLESVVLTALTWTHLLPTHAGCVAKGDRSILLCGDSHAGKSTLAHACARAGWTYISDNSLYWTRTEDRLVSGSPTIKLRNPSRRVDPRAEGFAVSRTSGRGPCVFLDRRPGRAVLHPYGEEDALAYFLSYGTHPDRSAAIGHYQALMQHGVWRIEYEHAEDAAVCLEQLL